MKAMVLRAHGGPEVLRMETVPDPEPGPGEVRIRVHSVGVNRTFDIAVRQGLYPYQVSLPHVLGVDPAGVVDTVGEGVEGLTRGQRVAVFGGLSCESCDYCTTGRDEDCVNRRYLGVHEWGGYAQYAVAPARVVFPIGDDVTFAEASFLLRHAPTAFGQLVTSADLQPGETVLVMGAAGALGLCAIQVAKLTGARVIAAAGGQDRLELADAFGADELIDYRREDLAQRVAEMTDGKGVEVVCENIGDPDLWPGGFRSLAYRGRLVTAGAHGGGQVTLEVRRLYLRRNRIIGSVGGSLRDIRRTLEAMRTGDLRAHIGCVLPLERAGEAHSLVEERSVLGKVALELGSV